MRAHARQFLLRVALLAACLGPGAAVATDFTDIWYIPQESGWGVNVVQSDAFLFLTFFIYGADNKPTWYTALLDWDGTRYSGNVYATQGTYWANPWNPADHPDAQAVGTASFEPDALNAYQATLVYAVNGAGSVTKHIVRQSLKPITIAGTYLGAQVGSYTGTGCTASGSYTDRYALSVTQSTTSAALTFNYDSGAVCTITGALNQNGQLYDMPNASYVCTGTLAFTTTAAVYELKATAQGLEGRLSANLPSGCQENASFAGVLY